MILYDKIIINSTNIYFLFFIWWEKGWWWGAMAIYTTPTFYSLPPSQGLCFFLTASITIGTTFFLQNLEYPFPKTSVFWDFFKLLLWYVSLTQMLFCLVLHCLPSFGSWQVGFGDTHLCIWETWVGSGC